MNSEKIIAIITGPSAVGKTTIAKEVLSRLKNFKASTTYTTRSKRKKDTEDKIMHYVSKNKFRKMIDDNKFIEWAQVYDNFYGTSKEALQEGLKTYNILMNIDVQGAKIIKKKFPKHISIFILPENIKDIETRINRRKMDKIMKIRRIDNAKSEIAQAEHFDYRIVNYNNKIEESVEKVIKILQQY